MVSPIVIGGPTGSGKSDYALALAKDIGGEIICADSRQVYAGMRIGTASPSDEELAEVPHHNYNIIDPAKSYDAAQFIEDTDRIVAEVSARGKTPILVGGTGLYLRCWRYGLSDVPGGETNLRAELSLRVQEEGLQAVYDELQKVDPESASRIYAQDEFRIVRALEIFLMTGHKASELRKSHFSVARQEAQWFLISVPRAELNERLLIRTQKMFEKGLVEEALALRTRVGEDSHLLKTMGYEEALALADGAIDLNAAVERTFIRTRQYAKRQVNWFSKEAWWGADLPVIKGKL